MSAGVRLDQRDKNGLDALDIGLQAGNAHTVELLLSLGANPAGNILALSFNCCVSCFAEMSHPFCCAGRVTADRKLAQILRSVSTHSHKPPATGPRSQVAKAKPKQQQQQLRSLSSLCIHSLISAPPLLQQASRTLPLELRLRIFMTVLETSTTLSDMLLFSLLSADVRSLALPDVAPLRWGVTQWRRLTAICPHIESFTLCRSLTMNAETLTVLCTAWSASLRHLDLSRCYHIMGSCAGPIARLSHLSALTLRDCLIDDEFLRIFASSANVSLLQQLDLSDTFITDAGLRCVLEHCNQLASLSIARTIVTDSVLPDIARCTGLTHLNILRCTRLSSLAVANTVLNSLPSLTTLCYAFASAAHEEMLRAQRPSITVLKKATRTPG